MNSVAGKFQHYDGYLLAFPLLRFILVCLLTRASGEQIAAARTAVAAPELSLQATIL